jgi:cell division protein FtsL
MSRLNILLLIVLLGCALSVVNATNKQREVFVDLQRAQSQARQLQQDYAQLQYQQSALSKTSRIESIATSDLKMQPVGPGRTQYLSVDPATVPPDSPAASDVASEPSHVASAGQAGAASSPASGASTQARTAHTTRAADAASSLHASGATPDKRGAR